MLNCPGGKSRAELTQTQVISLDRCCISNEKFDYSHVDNKSGSFHNASVFRWRVRWQYASRDVHEPSFRIWVWLHVELIIGPLNKNSYFFCHMDLSQSPMLRICSKMVQVNNTRKTGHIFNLKLQISVMS